MPPALVSINDTSSQAGQHYLGRRMGLRLQSLLCLALWHQSLGKSQGDRGLSTPLPQAYHLCHFPLPTGKRV